ncbi:MAG: glycosyltransferase family 39 protein [Spirochaetaceae bacterium]
MKRQLSEKSARNWIIAAILLVFLISSNIAWFNPWPDKEVYKGVDSIPFMWQYNRAAGVEILSAAYFPDTFETYTDRINRPTYPLLINLTGRLIGFVASPVVELEPLERAGAGYIVIKLLVFFLGGMAMFRLVRRYAESEVALLATLLMLLHAHSIEFVATFHTTELQVITPIFTLYLFADLAERYSHRRNIAYSIIFGILMLAKQNYAVYLAIFLFALYKKWWKQMGVSIVAHLIPLGLYLLYLREVGIPYVNHEAANYGQGVWLLDFITQNPIASAKDVVSSLYQYAVHLTGFFTVTIFAAAAAWPYLQSLRFSRDEWLLFWLLLFSTWAQLFAANRYYDYMTSDVAVFLFPMAVLWFVRTRDEKIERRRARKAITVVTLLFWFLANLLYFVNFPYIAPWEQPTRRTEVLENRLEMVENPDAFTDTQREEARGGRIIEPQEESDGDE